MDPKTLRVRAVGQTLVPRFDIPSIPGRFVNREPGEVTPLGAEWKPMAEASEIPNIAEFRECLRSGELAPADKATAEACGLKWNDSPKVAPSTKGAE